MCEIIREKKFPYFLLHWIGIGELSEGNGGNYENLEVYSIGSC